MMGRKRGFGYYLSLAGLSALLLAALAGIAFGGLALFGKDTALLIVGTLGVCVLIFGGAALMGLARDAYESGFWIGLWKAILFIAILFGAPVAAFFLYLALWGIVPAFAAAGMSFLISLLMVITVMSDGEFDGGGVLIGLFEIIGDMW